MKLVLRRVNLHEINVAAADSLDIGLEPTDAQLRRWYRALVSYQNEMRRLDRIVMLYKFEDGLSVASLPETVEFAVVVPLGEAPDA